MLDRDKQRFASARAQRCHWVVYLLLTAGLMMAWTGPGGWCEAGQIELAVDAPKPLPPEESQKLFRLPAGFHIELVASEPHVADPVAMAFDARGRILVCEIHGYNLEGYLDVLELNKTGVLDKAVRRIPAPPEAIAQAEKEQYGTVKVLQDTDGDGRIDHASVLADRLPPCYGVVPARDGAIVLCAPDIVYLADRDGDGTAEVRQTLFTGFGVGELWTRINNPRWAPDNWIYGVCGARSGGTVRGPNLAENVRLGSVCFRFKSDGTALEAASGRTSGFGQAIDDWGDRYLVTNQQHVLHVLPIPYRYLARNPFYAAPNLTQNISSYGHPARVYPTSKPDPWRRARAADPAWVRFYGAAEATANGYFTAASGQAFYSADQFPPEFRGNHFSVDNAQNMIHRCLLSSNGVSYLARRPREDERTEFLTSTEQWFRPVNLLTGPDGALYLVDMYRDVIEDYSAIPRYLQQLYIKSLIAGANRGRIWRIVANGAKPTEPCDLSRATNAELVAQLAHPNYWWRTTSQRLLVERGDRSVAGSLSKLAKSGATPQVRMHALYTLDGLDVLTAQVAGEALSDPHFAVRAHALRLAERWLDTDPALASRVLNMTSDPHPRSCLQLALSLGQSSDQRAVAALARLASDRGEDPWIAAAVLSSCAETADQVLATLLRRKSELKEGFGLLQSLASVVGARRDRQQVGNLLQAIGKQQDDRPILLACLRGLVQGLEQGRPLSLGSVDIVGSLRGLLVHDDAEVRQLSLKLAKLVRLEQTREMKVIFAQAQKTALDDEEPLPRRVEAISLLAGAAFEQLSAVVTELLDARQPLDLQLAAVKAVAAAEGPGVTPLLLSGFAGHTPKLQAEVMNAIFARQDRLPALLQAVRQGTVPRSSLDAVRREQLMSHRNAQVAKAARELLAGQSASQARQQVLAKYQEALSLPRDNTRGKAVFDKQCSKCHKLGDKGYEVGPDLLTARTRADETLISDILDPSNQITVGYNNYTVVTEDGKMFNGVLAAETATSVTLRREEKQETVILRKDIEEMRASALSMMPEDLEKEVAPQDVADLLGFLRQSLGSAGTSALVLFDDNEEFLKLLNQGKGRAWLESRDSLSGKASLAIAPPQRFSPRIPGWQYRISQNPGPGEYRYLRFAWKQRRGGHGVMLELAANGAWPAPDDQRCRYFSGKNTSGWNAVQVAEEAPNRWTVVTRDLWQDFGSFTLTGIAPTAMGGEALFDQIELLPAISATP